MVSTVSALIKGSGFTASQSSMGWGGVASRAIDGNTNGQYNAGSCSHSLNANNNWWKVDFHKSYAVTSVKVYNRVEYQERINGAQASSHFSTTIST